MSEHLSRWRGVLPLVETILKQEGATVTFTGSNPDFNGMPAECVTIVRAPEWKEETWRGETLEDCLMAAILDRVTP